MDRISVVVCAHNEEAYLAPCLHALLAQTRRPDEILVVDNASTDRTREVAEAVPGVRVVDEPRLGLVLARERGLAPLVIPELQRRGIFRREYEGATLRENLGLERPRNRFF